MPSLSVQFLPPPPPPPPPPSPPPPLRPPTLTHPENLFLDSSTTVHALNCCAAQRDLRLTTSVHAATLKSGVHSNLFVANSLVDAYVKCHRLDHATKLFDRMPQRDVVSWTSLITGHCRNGSLDSAISIFRTMVSDESAPIPNEFTLAALLQVCALNRDTRMGQMVHGYLIVNGLIEDRFVHHSLLDMYSKSGSISSAKRLISRLCHRDEVSWTVVISGCVLNGMIEEALVLYLMMLEDGVTPNIVTMLSLIQASSLMNETIICSWVHAWVIKLMLNHEVLVVSSLVEMYSKNGFLDEAMKLFLQLYILDGNWCPNSQVVSVLIQGCTLSGSLKLGEAVHGYLIKKGFPSCTEVENCLMGMYAKHEQVHSAHWLFKTMKDRDIVSWNTMISCFAKNSRVAEALQLLTEIHGKHEGGFVPDFVTMLSSIHACSEIASLQQGQILHGYVIKSGFNCDVFVGNALIDMYAKSGKIDFSKHIFEEMDVKDLGSWNSMIVAYGIHGDGHSAIRVFSELKKLEMLQPNAVTFASVVSACGHSGLATEGYECFNSMHRDYGIEPSMEHYASMVDLLGRSGKLKEAEEFIRNMPINPGSSVWGSLLGACRLFGVVDIAERAAERLSVLEPDGTIWRVALSNVYALAGRWENAAKVRAEMKREESRKEAGWSSIELRGTERFRFMAGDTRHPESKRIYEVLNGIKEQMVDAFVERL